MKIKKFKFILNVENLNTRNTKKGNKNTQEKKFKHKRENETK